MARTKSVSVAIPSEVANVVGQGVDGVDADEPASDLLRVAIETVQVPENLGVSVPLCGRELVPNTASDEVAMSVLARAAEWAWATASGSRGRWQCCVAEKYRRSREARRCLGGQRSDVADGGRRRSVGQPGFQFEAESPSVGHDG